MKFLEHRERGALFVNAAFRMQQHPHEPAFDFLTFNQLQGTMDKTLQESVAFYNPLALVIVFVLLPSQSGNSVAIWRRKVNVPDNARLKYQAEVNAIVKNLRKDKEYIVMVDEYVSYQSSYTVEILTCLFKTPSKSQTRTPSETRPVTQKYVS